MTNQNDILIKAEINELKSQFTEMLVRQTKTEATVEQLNKSIAAGNRLTIWQFIGFVFVMAGTLFGTLYWATGVLEKRIDQFEKNVNGRFEQIDNRFTQTDKRIEQVEKNLNARFEDLKQAVTSKR
jgi:flagellar capping protein FliD